MYKFSTLFLLLFLASSQIEQPATAQAWQCKAPINLPRPYPETPNRNEVRRNAVDGYILALSWSREYCKSRGRSAANKIQCNGSIGDFGFILHGLWPEAKGKNYPQYCRKVGILPRKVIQQNICMTPDVQLMQHEWAKHGSCMSRRPETYFSAARIMFNAIEFPDMTAISRRGQRKGDVSVATVINAFADINEDLPANAIKVKSNQRGWLQEIRICLGKDFRPRRCPSHVRGAMDKAEIKIWRGS